MKNNNQCLYKKCVKVFSLIMCTVILLSSVCFNFVTNAEKTKNENAANIIENPYYFLEVQNDGVNAGSFTIKSKTDGRVYNSNLHYIDNGSGTQLNESEVEIYSQLFCTIYDTELKQEVVVNSCAASDFGKNVKVSLNGTKLEIVYTFKKYDIELPFTVILDDKDILVQIKSNAIKENGKNVVMDVSVLPYFFYGDSTESGKIFVPDGSGAIIDFNSGKINSGAYSQHLYGTELDYYKQTKTTLTKTAHLPVYGIIKRDASVLAIIESADGSCTINSRVSGIFNAYNIDYGSFMLRSRYILIMCYSKGNTMNGEKIDLKNKMFDVATVRYKLLSANQSFFTLAKEYGKYLGIDETIETEIPQTFIEAYAGCIKKVSFLGIPIYKYYTLTTIDELSKIIDDLDITDSKISVIYRNADKNLAFGKMQKGIKLNQNLGSLKSLKSLKDELKGKLYYEYNPYNVTKNGNGFIKRFHCSKRISQDLMTESSYSKSTYYVDSKISAKYIVNPNLLEKYSNRALASFEKNDIFPAFTTLGNTLYTNFDEKDYSTRDNTKKKIVDVINNTSGVIYNPNAYAIKYASEIVDVPVESSRFDIEDETVPFYQMVLNGVKDYAVNSINLSEDRRKLFLNAMATASSIKFTVIDECIDDEKNIDHTELYGVCYNSCKDEINEMIRTMVDVYKQIGTRIIKDFYYVDNGVSCTVFENGKKLYVNTSEKDFALSKGTVPYMSYLIN